MLPMLRLLPRTHGCASRRHISTLTSVSPLDGRYADLVAPLAPYFSEHALIKARLDHEVAWLKFLLSETPDGFPAVTTRGRQALDLVVAQFCPAQAARVKAMEQRTKHDVKAVEYYLCEEMDKDHELRALRSMVHFGCTSEDINNLAYAGLVQAALRDVILPDMTALRRELLHMAALTARMPMLSLTHGQPASPTTLGKEMANYAHRLGGRARGVADVRITGKFNGAVGTYSAWRTAVPHVDWQHLTTKFIHSRGLHPNLYTTQIEPHDWLAELCHALMRHNTVLLGLNRDLWGYVSRGYFHQHVVATEVGSSTMPHKTNPISFENSEGNLGVANALLGHLADKLPVSRFQRDLSDSTALRNLGVALGHCRLAYVSTRQGLARLSPNAWAMQVDLDDRYELLAEAVQTVLRLHGDHEAYEKLK